MRKTPRKPHIWPEVGPKTGTIDPNLRVIIDAWPTLSVTVKGYIKALVIMPTEKVHSLEGLLVEFAQDCGDIFENARRTGLTEHPDE